MVALRGMEGPLVGGLRLHASYAVAAGQRQAQGHELDREDLLQMATPFSPISYTSYDGEQLTLFPWVGDNIAILTASNVLDGVAIDAILDALDRAYDVYVAITGRTPTPYLTYDGRLSIAEVPTAFHGAAAAIGFLGYTGIEITRPAWNIYYSGVSTAGLHEQTLFYELGRNFWFYGDALGAVDPFVTGFAIVNRFISMEVAQIQGAPFGTLDFATLKSSILEGLAATFFGGSAYSLGNTLGANAAPASLYGWSAADFAASLLYRVYEDFGLSAYSALYQTLANAPAAATPAQVYENLIAAASAATGVDYGYLNKPLGVSYVVGGSGADLLQAASGAPVLAFGGSDTIAGSEGADRVFAGAGMDSVAGGGANDLAVGGMGADTLSGQDGRDTLMGGDGDDLLRGGGGADSLVGGEGADTFSFGWEETTADLVLFRNGGHPNKHASDQAWAQYDRLAERSGFTTAAGSYGGHTLWARSEEGEGSYSNLSGVDTLADFRPTEGDRLHFGGIRNMADFTSRLSASRQGELLDLTLDGIAFLRVQTSSSFDPSWIV